jgi:pilus assembly protein CpaF
MVDARLPDGSRVNAVIAPLAIGGPFLTIRKFAKDPFTVEDLINFGSFSRTVAQFLDACVKGRLNVIVSGGTGTGKTTALNVLSSFIPHDERIVTVEDAKELQLHQDHVLALESRPPNVEGKGEVRIRDLVRNTLRMRPDRIVVGECRGGEALDMLQAMNTGHDGSITTVHSNSPRDTLARIETMVLMAGMDLPVRAIREQMASAIDLIVHLTRLRDGTRRVTHVSEVQGMEGDVIVLQDLFLFDFGMGVDENGRFLGHLKSTGIRPKFGERLADNGIRLRPEIFAQEPFARRMVGAR